MEKNIGENTITRKRNIAVSFGVLPALMSVFAPPAAAEGDYNVTVGMHVSPEIMMLDSHAPYMEVVIDNGIGYDVLEVDTSSIEITIQ